MSRSRLRLAIWVTFGLLGLGFLVVTFLRTWDSAQGIIVPTLGGVLGAIALVLGGLLAAARSWVVLFSGHGSTTGLIQAFFRGQLGKYIPGGVWQAAGQVGLSVDRDVGLPRAAAAFPVHTIVQVAAGLTVGGFAGFFAADSGWILRWAPSLGFFALPLLVRRWLAVPARWIASAHAKLPGPESMPSQVAILRSFGWSLVTIVTTGSAFSLLLLTGGAPDHFVAGALTFSLGWAAGFLALPVPSGLGVREGVMMTYLASSAPVVIGASILYRLIAMGIEGVLASLTYFRRR